jgi:DNA-binding winged helix-turn-helix (wHTH) protein/tetratricopeptide (TPR) repeat protein
MVSSAQTRAFRFGVFETDLLTRELRKQGRIVKLQSQSFQLLLRFLERPGELVTRNDIRRTLWPGNLHVDFDHGVNNAVHRLRRVLGDTAHKSRLIENVSRNGYRFVAAVEPIADSECQSAPSFPVGLIGCAYKGHRERSTCRVDAEARELYLKGRYCWNLRTPEALLRALKFFQRAIEKDSGYAQAFAGLADSYALLGTWQFEEHAPIEVYPQAKAAARRAVELDDTLGEAHTSLGVALATFEWDFQAANEQYQQAIELNPAYATARQWYAHNLSDFGNFDEAIVQMKMAERLEPLSLAIGADVAHIFLCAGLDEQSIAQCQKVLELDPTFAQAHFELGQAFLKTERYSEAAREFRTCIALSGDGTRSKCHLAHVLGVVGKREQAARIFNEVEARAKRHFVHCENLASVCVGLGENSRAVTWLEKAYEQRFDLSNLAWPIFDSLRSDMRFRNLARHAGLPA